MASLAEIRAAAQATIAAAIPELHPYGLAADVVNSPAFMIKPATADFLVAMGRGTDTYVLDVTVMVAHTDLGVAQEHLDPYLTGAGARSIRQAIFLTRTLGRGDCDAHIAGMRDYGQYTLAGSEYVGATLRLVVHTSGTG